MPEQIQFAPAHAGPNNGVAAPTLCLQTQLQGTATVRLTWPRQTRS